MPFRHRKQVSWIHYIVGEMTLLSHLRCARYSECSTFSLSSVPGGPHSDYTIYPIPFGVLLPTGISATPSNLCGNGYYEQIGDIQGWGAINGRGNGESVTSCSECETLCTGFGSCLSYECSPIHLHCNLNTAANPALRAHADSMFCTKSGNHPTLSLTLILILVIIFSVPCASSIISV